MRLANFCALMATGAAWGITQPLSKVAVSEGYRHVGIIFWQSLVGALLLGVFMLFTGRSFALSRPAVIAGCVVALVGTMFPNFASYEAARYLPAGWLSIFISTVPIFTFVIAMPMGTERFSWLRLAGLLLGFCGVLVLFAPAVMTGDMGFDGGVGGHLPLVVLIALALIAPAFYGFEGNFVVRFGTGGLGPVRLLFWASVVCTVLSLPAAMAAGEFINPFTPWGRPEYALLVICIVHALTYVSYVWLVGRAGAVFAAQVGYVVTIAGVVWAMFLLDERYGAEFYLSMALIFAGVFLVQPRGAPRPAAQAARAKAE
ncbi:DMT family transporter [Alphaproteobacteria bacterium KMM 3653]|uniref:DMT family transporter n=1 Tax=Harenicola maris TaxID=2841044 RepID=A0AAP2CMC1_9RHOB|nr:DMT family transporter [Harenicola maris]